MRRQRARSASAAAAGLVALATLGAASPFGAAACALVASEHRSERELLRLPLAAAAPRLQLAFTHSVLGTPVTDEYQWRTGRWTLVEERFEGEGYGLPHVAAAGERLVRHGTGWSLQLDRAVAPLVVRPLPALRMRLVLADGREVLLGELSREAIELRATGC